uniref:Enoyl reductase (ER) domain-containing protein n=1 Tax=Bicosoecida sp. CB-2014 TaxID=1486930 RepID=A0A6T6YIW8_9STRA
MAAEGSNQAVIFAKRPDPAVTPDCMEVVAAPTPDAAAVKAGHVLVKTTFVSVDPYMRGRMSDAKSYAAGFQLGQPMYGGCVGEVVAVAADTAAAFAVGDVVTGFWGWARLIEVDASKGLRKVPDALLASGAPASLAVGVVGMPGWSAFLPIKHIAKPKEGDVVWVTGAAGAVGMTAGQIFKIKGCRVIGSAGSDEKVAKLKELGFDEAFNYKTKPMKEALKEYAPDGIDIFWDNVGGEATEVALNAAKTDARFVMCGAISQYNLAAEERYPIRNLVNVIGKRIHMEGFIVSKWAAEFAEASMELAGYVASGQLKFEETVIDGFENIPTALCGLFSGRNTGKMVVKV